MSVLLLLGWLFAGDVDRLESESWEAREAAHARLKRAGLLAVPALRRGMAGESPEVRHRCAELLGRWRGFKADCEAAAVLAAPEMPPSMIDYYANIALRKRVRRIAIAAGCVYCDPCPWEAGVEAPIEEQTIWEAEWMLQSYRYQLGTEK